MVKGTSLVARTIQRITGSPYSHCGFAIGDRTFEADVGGFVSRDLRSYPWPYDLYAIPDLTETGQMNLRYWCAQQLLKRRGYDYGKVLGLWLEYLLGVCGFRSMLDSKRAYTCVEAVYEGLRYVEHTSNVDLGLVLEGPQLYPGDLVREPCLVKLPRGDAS
jgi:hypothetical protein